MKIRLLFPNTVPASKNVSLTSVDDLQTFIKDFLTPRILPLIVRKGSLILRNHILILRNLPMTLKYFILTLEKHSLTLRKDFLVLRNVFPAFKKDFLTLRNVFQTLVEVCWCFNWYFLWLRRLIPILPKVFLRRAGLFLRSGEDLLNLEKPFLTSGNYFLTSGKHFLTSAKTAALRGSRLNPFIHLRSPPREQKPKINGSS